MCGIAGIFNLKEREKEISHSIVKKMVGAIKHRGPDGEGFYYDSRIGLGFCRLAINDLSEKANQPMTNENGSVAFVCNGEIYNFPELRESLEKKGHIFKSHGDSEVIGHLYEEFGLDFVEKLNGMFAIALWDSKKEQLLLIRDRLGIKPLYRTVSNGKVIFASEAKAILEYPGFSKEIDFEAMDFYFSYKAVPPSEAIFKSIKPVQPATLMIIKGNEIKEIKYWSLHSKRVCEYSFKKAKSRFLELLIQSVEKHFMADVSVGLFLSGGLDSSSLLALGRFIFPNRRIPTFTLGFKLSNGSMANMEDFTAARRLSKIFKTDHHEFVISDKDFIGYLDEIVAANDEPCPLSPVSFFIAKEASRHVKAAIRGDGADELLGGYGYHERAMGRPRGSAGPWYNASIFSHFSDREKEKLYALPRLKKHIGAFRNFAVGFSRLEKNTDVLNRLLNFDLTLRLPQYSLMPMDCFSMAHSLEIRVPYLDNALIDFILGLPGKMKINGTIRKYILREAVKSFLPPEIFKFKKSPFEIPKENWLPLYAGKIKSVLSVRRLKKHGFFSDAAVRDLMANRKMDQLWTLFCFQLWWEKHFA